MPAMDLISPPPEPFGAYLPETKLTFRYGQCLLYYCPALRVNEFFSEIKTIYMSAGADTNPTQSLMSEIIIYLI